MCLAFGLPRLSFAWRRSSPRTGLQSARRRNGAPMASAGGRHLPCHIAGYGCVVCSTFDPEQSIAVLQQYQRPEAFLAEVDKSHAVTDERFFNDSRLKKLQEAWIAGECAHGLELGGHYVEVRLVGDRERFPDFEVRFDGSHHQFEVVTVIKPNRKLGAEYKLRETIYSSMRTSRQTPLNSRGFSNCVTLR